MTDELIPEIDDKDVSIHAENLERDIRALISYAVGCMFGRYSMIESTKRLGCWSSPSI